MDVQKYTKSFLFQVQNIYCIIDYNLDSSSRELLQNEFERVGLDTKLIFYYMSKGSINDNHTYYNAIRDVCIIASELQGNKPYEPILIFKGNVRFIDFHMQYMVLVATSLNIYAKSYDIFNLSCEDAVYHKILLGRNVFRGTAKGDYALILPPTTITKLASIENKHKSLSNFIESECKNQLLLAQPICYRVGVQTLENQLIKSDMSSYIWFTIGKFIPYNTIQRFFYWNMVTTLDIN